MRTRPWASALVLVTLVLATYANAFHGAWLFDDEFLVLRNRFLDSFSHLGEIFTTSSTAGAGFRDLFYRPMQGFAYLVVNQLFGRDKVAFHALNIGLHAVNALFVFALGRRLRLDDRAAFLGALLWCVHPLHVEAISYVSATADPLHAFFTLAAINVVVPRFTRARVLAGLGLFTLALLSKESAIVLPALLVAILFFVDERPTRGRTYLGTLPFWIVAALYFGARKFWIHGEHGLAFFGKPDAYADHLFTRVWTSLATLPSYLELLVWPHDLHMDREFPTFTSPWMSDVLGGLVILGLAAVVAFDVRRRPTLGRRFALFAVTWVAAAHAPHSGILMPVNSVFLEHWMYLTSIPLFLGVGLLLARVRRPAVLAVVAGIPTLALARKTHLQNEIWSTPLRFFSHTLAYSPSSARIRHNYAMALLDEGRTDEGLRQLELMIAANTPYPATYHTAAHVYLERRDLDRAEAYYLRAVAIDPRFYPSLQDLAVVFELRGDRAKSDDFRRRAEALRPEH